MGSPCSEGPGLPELPFYKNKQRPNSSNKQLLHVEETSWSFPKKKIKGKLIEIIFSEYI